jgi:hypothetical protein
MARQGTRTAVAWVATALAVVVTAGGALSAAEPRPPAWALRGPYRPSINSKDFVSTVDNRYFPLKPGTSFRYRGVRDGTAQTDDVVVTRQIKIVLGIKCTVVRDTVSSHGRPLERTFDWYAQDKQGNVWYMGEDALELKNDKFVRASDSWEAGVHGAKPGMIMPATPHPGMVYRQEYYPPGGALDQAKVLRTNVPARDASGASRRALLTIEWSPVEPQLEAKEYVAGLGEINERVVAGGHEQFRLVSVTH